MSLIKSLHSSIKNETKMSSDTETTLIKDITIHIINSHSPLIVDIENGRANKELLEKEIVKYLDRSSYFHMSREIIIRDVFNYMFGYSHLQKFIDDESVSDIDGSRYDFFMIKRNGIKEIVPITFESEESFHNFCKLIIIRNGGVINENDCHSRVADHKFRLRINVSIKPRNISGTSLTIRKHRKNSYGLEDLVKLNTLSEEMKNSLVSLMRSTARIIIVGKGASGKTTLLRALLDEIPITERILVCESDSELYPSNPNFIVQKVQKGDSKRHATLEDLVKDGLTMSLDGYCVGEIVGVEVWEFLKAGYTDHKIFGTLHALGVEETFFRILTMLGDTTTNMNDENMLSFLANSMDIIIYMKKFKVMCVSQVIKYDKANKKMIINDLFNFESNNENDRAIHGHFVKKNRLDGSLSEEIERRSI